MFLFHVNLVSALSDRGGEGREGVEGREQGEGRGREGDHAWDSVI